ncbi:MAG: hypothetical protein OHK0022_52210 [Roseiflexaceae bacterium]
MVEMIVQLVIIAVWLSMVVVHTRRLLRLAQVEIIRPRTEQRLRMRLSRLWWWLGREEFWHKVQADCFRCVQVTLMLFLLAWGMHV